MSDTNGQGVIWDVDGTLVDTAGLHFQAWAELCRALDRPFTAADFAATFGQRNPEILGKLFGTRFNDVEIADLGERKEVLYRAAARRGVALLPGVKSAPGRTACGGPAPGDRLQRPAGKPRADHRVDGHRVVFRCRGEFGGHGKRQARSAGLPGCRRAVEGDAGKLRCGGRCCGRGTGCEGRRHEVHRRHFCRPSSRFHSSCCRSRSSGQDSRGSQR